MKTRKEILEARQDLEANKALLTSREYAEYLAELEAMWAEVVKG